MAYGPRLYQDYTHMQEAVDMNVIHIKIIVQMLLFKIITMIFLILYITITLGHNFLLLFCRIRVPRSSPGMLVAIIDGSRPTSILSLGLRVAFVTLLLIASIAGVVVIGVHGMVGFASDLGIHVLVPPLLSPFPLIRIVAQCRTWWSKRSMAELVVDRSCWLLGMGLRLCSAQGIRGRRFKLCK